MNRFVRVALALSIAASSIVASVAARPAPRGRAESSPIGPDERARTIAALARPERARPLVAVVASNGGTETTDLLVPFGVLRRSGVVDVELIAASDEPLDLVPALRVRPMSTLRSFVARHPEGADYVVVPAMHDPSDPAVVAFVRDAARAGAIVIGVCEGARVLGHAGLLEGRRATTHWFARDALREDHPTMRLVLDRRIVVDRRVVTTTGVSASLPLALAIVEAVGGAERAGVLAETLGAEPARFEHASARYRIDSRSLVALANAARVLGGGHDTIGIPVEDGVDEVALAFVADAYSRTGRTSAYAFGPHPVTTRSGLFLLPDRRPRDDFDLVLPLDSAIAPGAALGRALERIEARYDRATADFVALQLELE